MTRVLWVVLIALLAVRMTDAHLHMCFDGQEPRSSLHVSDSGQHHDSTNEANHVDTDVSLSVLVLLKAGKLDSNDLPLLLLGAFALWGLFAPRTRDVVPVASAVPVRALLFFLRPPLRGPPSLDSL